MTETTPLKLFNSLTRALERFDAEMERRGLEVLDQVERDNAVMAPCMGRVYPLVIERGEGCNLVITASAAGYLPLPSLPAYGTTKAAVLMLAQCLAGELAGDGIAVSAICPGFVHTNITSAARFAGLDSEDEQAQRARATEAYRRRGFGPEKVAAAVVAAVKDGRTVVPVTPEAKLGAVGNRLSPDVTRAALAALNRRL